MAWIITGLIILGGLHQQGLNKKKRQELSQDKPVKTRSVSSEGYENNGKKN